MTGTPEALGMPGDPEEFPSDPGEVEPRPVSRATLWRLAAGVAAVYVATLLVILIGRSAG